MADVPSAYSGTEFLGADKEGHGMPCPYKHKRDACATSKGGFERSPLRAARLTANPDS